MPTNIITKTPSRGKVTLLLDWLRRTSIYIGIGRPNTWAPLQSVPIDEPPDYPYNEDGLDDVFNLQLLVRAERVIPVYESPLVEADVVVSGVGWRYLLDQNDIEGAVRAGVTSVYIEASISDQQYSGTYRTAGIFTDPTLSTDTIESIYLRDQVVDPGALLQVVFFSPITTEPSTRSRFRFILPY
jgi:hypothetical protein